MAGHDAAAFLFASPARTTLLTELGDGAAAPRDLVAATDVSRASVQRHLSAFVDRGWVRRDAGSYTLTAAGEAVLEQATRFLDGLAGAERAAPVLAGLPAAAAPDPTYLTDATVTVVEEARPHAPVECYLDWLDGLDPDRIRGMSPVLSRVFDEGHAALLAEGVETELVLPGQLVDRARQRDPERFVDALSTDAFTLLAHPDPIGFGLAVTPEAAFLGAYDPDGRMIAGCHAQALQPWGRRIYERYRDEASPVTTVGCVADTDLDSDRESSDSAVSSTHG